MKRYRIGYTAGTYDLFHIGHLNVIKNAKEMCDFLIVAVSTDELVSEYKHHLPIIPFSERFAIVESIKYVDKVVPQINMDKKQAAMDNNIDVMFVGDDWKGTAKWKKIESDLKSIGVDVVYLPHTDGISTTDIRHQIEARGHQQ